jgi:glutathione S-transferase
VALTFYYGSGSPYAWRVHLALEHKRISYTGRLLSFSQEEHKTPEFSAINPRQRVPALVDEDFTLYESSAMLEYLDERFPSEPQLFSGDLRTRARTRRRIREADAYFGEPLEVLVEELFSTADPSARDAARIRKAEGALQKELARLEDSFNSPFLEGSLGAADFTWYSFLALLPRFELRSRSLALSSAIGPKTRVWKASIEALPYFEKTYPPHWRD